MNETARRIWTWFFARGGPHSGAVLRIVFGIYALWVLWDLYPVLDVVFGHEGMAGTLNPDARMSSGPLDFLYAHDSPAELALFYWAYVGASVALCLGLCSRLATVAVLLAHTLLCERNGSFPYGADNVFQHMLFFMAFLDTGRVWAVDAWIARKRGRAAVTEVELWPLRCMQLQVAVIYLFTGYFKLSTDVWSDGSAVWYAVQGVGLDTAFTPWLLRQRELIVALTYGTLVFELGFPLLVFTSYRYVVLLAGVAFHLGIDMFMMIRFFSFVMFASYLAYVEPEDWLLLRERCMQLLARRIRA